MRLKKYLVLGLVVLFVSSLAAEAGKTQENQESLNQSLRQEAIAGVIPALEDLIRRGAEINGKAPHGETALEYAIRFGRNGAALRLIQLGADPNVEDDSGLTPLLRAAGECNASRVVDALLRAGANVNHSDGYGRTALINAAHADCERTVAVLFLRAKQSVDIDARNDAFQIASDLARNGPVMEMLEMAHKYQRRKKEDGAGLVQKPFNN